MRPSAPCSASRACCATCSTANRGAADRVPLREELDFVRDYLDLETLRLGPRLSVAWRIDDAALDAAIPPLTLQPLVENAIVHGIAPRAEPGTVQIDAERPGAAADLVLRVRDDGARLRLATRAVDGRARIGLSALRRRFELDYDGRARLDIRSAPGQGFCVEIVIPANEQES